MTVATDLRPPARPVRRRPRPPRRVRGGRRRRGRPLHPGLAGAVHRRRPQGRRRASPASGRPPPSGPAGKCSILIGAGVNHWYHADLTYRAAITALLVTGCVGKNGGGLNHYVGQEKLAPVAPVGDARGRPRLGPPAAVPEHALVPLRPHRPVAVRARERRAPAQPHPAPAGRSSTGTPSTTRSAAVRRGWLPFFPQFDRNPLELVRRGAQPPAPGPTPTILGAVVKQLADGEAQASSVEDPDAPENWPRVWFIWRGNALVVLARRGTSTSCGTTSARTTRRSRKETARGLRAGGRLARPGAEGQARPRRRPQLPDGHVARCTPTSSCPPPPGTRRTTSTPPTCTPSSTPCRPRCRRAGSRGATGTRSSRSPGR